jgi:hypothetical protein
MICSRQGAPHVRGINLKFRFCPEAAIAASAVVSTNRRPIRAKSRGLASAGNAGRKKGAAATLASAMWIKTGGGFAE